jgi:tight adherence protein C
VILLIIVLFVAASAFAFMEVATYPARLKARSIKRAADYGRVRVLSRSETDVRFRERIVQPAAARLAAVALKLNPRLSIDAIGTRLLSAGLAQRVTPASFLAVKGAATVAGALFGFLLVAVAGSLGALVLPLAFGAMGFIAPEIVLSSRIRSRRDSVRSKLPDALDLLAVSVEAGLGFDGAITKLTEHMDGSLVEEFGLLLSEIRMGESRQTALKNMAERVGAPELSSFVRAVVQADQLGISLGRILRVQAADSRLRRQAAAEEKAMKAPIKMLFPTMFFIFPAMFVVLLAPAMMALMKTL